VRGKVRGRDERKRNRIEETRGSYEKKSLKGGEEKK
jgi:hypothetical protein